MDSDIKKRCCSSWDVLFRDIGGKLKTKIYNISNIILSILIIVDVILIASMIVFNFPYSISSKIVTFDIAVCLILFFDFVKGYYGSQDRYTYLKLNYFQLIVAIPWDLFFSPFLGVAYLDIIKFIRVLILTTFFFKIVGEFLKDTRLDEILGIVFVIIIGSTLGLYLVDPSMNNLFDNLWFVIVSITTVGYGDIIPTTAFGKVVSLILLIIGVFMFSAITGAISSYFMDNLLQEGSYHIHELKNNVKDNELELEKINDKLEKNEKKIDELKREIQELKEIIKEK